MRGHLRRAWPFLKAILWLVILFAIGRQFARDLRRPELWQRPLPAGWLILSALLYLLGLGFSAVFWGRLLGRLGTRPPWSAVLQAYYIGHLGKYVPGKAWALLLRSTWIGGSGVPLGRAALTSFYEVLTTMASGVLVAAVLFAVLGINLELPSEMGDWPLVHLLTGHSSLAVVLLAALLFVLLLVPLLPAVFHRLLYRLSLPRGERDAESSPQLRWTYLFEGLALTAVGWLFLGMSLAAVLRGILGDAWPLFTVATARLPAIMGLAYVIGFIVLIAPGGLGVREFLLTLLLTPQLSATAGMEGDEARAVAELAVLVLRLLWTAAEVIAALGWRFGRTASRQPRALS